jgi:diaminohydroxyphosphoribosylaminopyrimidine deaminase/5-amino-6-(5-phosphoribosylamino)uracil reductase
MNDEYFMAQALREAENGLYTSQPNPRVGCVLVQDGSAIASGYHLTDGKGHAEANALAKLAAVKAPLTAYVTLEPCSFQGRTPSCAHALVAAGVTRVVYAMTDPHPANRGKGLDVLRAAGVKVDGPLMESSARALNPGHIKKYDHGIPYVRLKLAMTMDGKTALSNGESQWITGAEARRDVQKLRARSSAIVTGVQTIIDDDPQLTVRASGLDVEFAELSAQVRRKIVVLDSRLRIPSGASVLENPDTVIVCVKSALSPAQSAAGQEASHLGAQLWSTDEKGSTDENAHGRVDLHSLLQQLAKAGCNEVLFECGATLAGSLISAGLVDELVIYTAPKLMGNEAKSLLNFASPDNMRDLVELEIKDVRQLGRDLKIIARISSPAEDRTDS